MENEKLENAVQEQENLEASTDGAAEALTPDELSRLEEAEKRADLLQKKNKRANIVIIVLLALALLGVVLAVWAKSLPSTNVNDIISLL